MEELFTNIYRPLSPFGGVTANWKDSRFVIMGAPLEFTVSWFRGQKNAPNSIRLSAYNIEWSCISSGKILQDNIPLYDIGNISPFLPFNKFLDEVGKKVSIIIHSNKLPILLGGEHTVTLPAVQYVKPDALVLFDAHLDLRDELNGFRIGHGTWLRRLLESQHLDVLAVGARAFSQEEISFAHVKNIFFIPPFEKNIEKLKDWLKRYRKIYLSIDLDVFDPAYTPEVGNPEPFGISPREFLSLLMFIPFNRVCGFDIVEAAPTEEKETTTTILAAKIVLELISNFIY